MHIYLYIANHLAVFAINPYALTCIEIDDNVSFGVEFAVAYEFQNVSFQCAGVHDLWVMVLGYGASSQ